LLSLPSRPAILLLSDHGFRRPGTDMEDKYDFMNLNAVFLPNGNYQQFYDSISNVNQFRALFNSLFRQRYRLLKDSTTDLWD
jgi:hypothetical protein